MRLHRRRTKGVPGLNTAALPDLIFTVLFFFMIVTHMRQTDVKVRYTVPEGQNLTELRKKNAVTFIYIGKDKGGNTSIQVNNDVVAIDQLTGVISKLRSRVPVEEKEYYTISLKADKDTPLSVINEVKEALRKAEALKIHYSATEKN